MAGTSGSINVSTKLGQIAKLAREMPQAALTTLAHHIDVDWLREAHRRTRKDGATGIDRQSADEYARNLDENLPSLLERAKSGSYVAPPVRRVHIPKAGDGSQTRPIGIPTFEDKVLQRAVAMVLEAVYEQSFRDCSYGFRPRRSAHQALRVVQSQTVKMAGKWLNAGVMEHGAIEYPEAGTPQGGVISPILANIYLHEVLDEWFARQVVPRLAGRAILVRFADDLVIIFEYEQDARRVFEVLPKRLAKYGLTLHPEKTRLIDFRRPDRRVSAAPNSADVRSRPETFDLLGFTHYWAMSRKGFWVVKQKTAADRFRRTLKRIADWCQRYRHEPVAEQMAALRRKLLGHFAYFGITGNFKALRNLRYRVIAVWRKWLSRRSQRAWISWAVMMRLLTRYPLPEPHIRPANVA